MNTIQNISKQQKEFSEEFFHNIFSKVGDGIMLADAQALLLEANPRSCEMLGYSRDELIGRSLWELTPADEVSNVLEKLGKLAIDKFVVGESAFFRKDGARLPVEISATLLSNGQMLGIVRDITERKQAERASRESVEKFRALVENSLDGIVIIDEQGTIVEWNHGQEKITGLKESDVLGQPVWEIQLKLQPEELRSAAFLEQLKLEILETLGSGHGPGLYQPFEMIFQLSDRTHRNVEIMRYVYKTDIGRRMGSIVRDITKRKQVEMLLEYLAMHDGLTDLPNRQLFQDRFELALERVRREPRGMLAIMMIDLDNFKQANDSYGHAYGDQLLRIVAQRLQDCMRKSDTVARMGGDEFALIIEEVMDLESGQLIAQKVLNALSEPMEIEGRAFKISASIGISLYTPDSNDPATLLRQADIAMYQAKNFRDCYRFYNPVHS